MFSPVVAAGRVYITVPYLQCINAPTGTPIWSNSSVGVDAWAPAVLSGKVYVCNNTDVYCLDASTGDYVWNFTTSQRFVGL